MPQEVVDARNQRLKRASDISMKHSELPAELQAKQTPYEHYLKASAVLSVLCARMCCVCAHVLCARVCRLARSLLALSHPHCVAGHH